MNFHDRPPGKIDYDQVRVHYQKFLDILTTEVQPSSPGGAMAYASWIGQSLANTHLAEDAKKAAEIRAGLLRSALDFFLAEPGRFHRLSHWRSCLAAWSGDMEIIDRADEAHRYLARIEERLKGVKFAPGDDANVVADLMAALARRHPHLRGKDPEASLYRAAPVFGRDDLKRLLDRSRWSTGGIVFRRLILDEDVAAVVCTLGIGRQERFGLLRLDPQTLRPVSFTEHPVDFKSESNWPVDEHARYGPPVTVFGGDIYVGSAYAGIVHFPAEGPAKWWSEKGGLASDQIRSLAVLAGKIYATTGTVFTDRGLIEFDPATGKSRILFSSKAADSPHELDGRPIQAVAADPKRNCLWLAVGPKPQAKDRGALFAYYPAQAKAVRKMDAERGLDWLDVRQGKLLMGSITYALTMDLQTEAIAALISSDLPGYLPVKAARVVSQGSFNGSRILLPVGRRLIWMDHKNPYTGSLSAMAEGDARPISIIEKCFPDRPTEQLVHDLALSRQGLVLLTRQGLFLASLGGEREASAR
jgi:hypothetical protein